MQQLTGWWAGRRGQLTAAAARGATSAEPVVNGAQVAAAGPAAAAMAAVAATGAGPELEAGVAEEEAAALDAATQARLGVLAQVVGRLQRRR